MSFAAAQEIKATTESLTTLLPVAAVLLPWAGALVALLAGYYSEKLRNLLAVLTALGTFALVLSIYPYVQQGTVVYHFADVMNYGLYFRADFLSFVFAALFSGSWLLATIYATVYMKKEHAQNRFYFFLLATLAHCLGVVLAGDLFSLFLFFELMTFSSYVLVIHRQTPGAIRAGSITIYMGVAGGLALLMGIFILFWGVGTLELTPMLENILEAGINPLVVIPLFMIGFGIKMGMAPLHIWLPRAYEEGPSPVNAISSAAMLKAGAYGMIRILGMVFTPANPSVMPAGAEVIPYIGLATLWLGIITMVMGAALAMLQNDAKRILGYSSISQMGYILMSIGVAVFLGFEKGAVGFSGAMYHIINHSVFKAALFMMVGAVYLITRDVDITRVRGMMKKVPFLAVTFLIAYAGIAGVPGGNGYASKAIMHRAVVYAYRYGGEFASLLVAEKLYVLASAMTVVYFARLFEKLFLGRTNPEHSELKFKISPLIKGILALYSLGILAIGFFPNFVLNRLVIPAGAGFSFDAYGFNALTDINFFLWYDLKEPLLVFGVAAVMYLVIDHLRGFEWKPPVWLSVEYVFYLPLSRFFLNTCCNFSASFDSSINKTYTQSGKFASGIVRAITVFDSSVNKAYENSGDAARRLVEKTERFDGALNDAYDKSSEIARQLADRTTEPDEFLDDMNEKSDDRSQSIWDRMRGRPSDWNIKNLNFDSLLLALMLGLFLFILAYYTRFN
jgi:formate hydrogenlyase subunit 3/multisubunit Na+/H+ antiporter MnhD subunit